MSQHSHKPIGIFDSGVGGLTVQKALVARLPFENTVYLGDTARVPYGTKSADVVVRYSVRNAQFLVEQDIKLLVVACNTASAVAIPELQAKLDIPVLGVIEPGADAAARATRSGHLGVIGTPGTIRSGAYQRAVEAIRPGTRVEAKACPLFVPLAEEGWTSGEVPTLVAREYLTELSLAKVDTLVLGCTHYPLLKDVIASVMGPTVALVDSAEATAEAVAAVLHREKSLAPARAAHVNRRYFVTDIPEPFLRVAGRFLGHDVHAAEQIDLSFTR
jgi:glutamate racemase